MIWLAFLGISDLANIVGLLADEGWAPFERLQLQDCFQPSQHDNHRLGLSGTSGAQTSKLHQTTLGAVGTFTKHGTPSRII